MVEERDGLCVPESNRAANATMKAYLSMPEFRAQPPPLWRVAGAWRKSPRPWDFSSAAEDHGESAADSNPFLLAAPYRLQ